MDSIHIAISDTLADGCLDVIRNVHPRVEVTDVSAWVAAELAGEQAGHERLDHVLARCEIVYGHVMPPDLIPRAPGLKWIQSTWTGVDSVLNTAIVESPVVVTNIAGIHEIPIAECVLAFMLMFAKKAPHCFDLKQNKRWQRFVPGTLANKTLGIVGLGGVGRELARLAKAFRMKVVAVRRSAADNDRADNVDELLAAPRLHRLLGQSDFVALTLPGTPETVNLIGESELRAMKSTACLINISRGDIVDEHALIRALEQEWIAGAALDVFRTEPLPADNTLWRLPNVIFCPHVTGEVEDYDLHVTKIFCENLRRYVAGKALRNVVNKRAGY